MKYRIIKAAIAVLIMTIAGFCYSCSRMDSLNTTDNDIQYEASTETDVDQAPDESTSYASKVEHICVYVCGEVLDADVYELKSGSRYADAIEAAGGFTEYADREYLNLAETLSDGMRIYVPSYEEVKEEQSIASSYAEDDGKVNINTADKNTLMTLKGIGEVKAQDIIDYREKHGSFSKPEDIMLIPGIKDAAYEKIKDSITV